MHNNTQPATAFISYASEDIQLAKCIDRFLQIAFTNRIKVFVDVKIGAGEFWREEIAKKLDAAEIFILLLSRKSIQSMNVAKEVATIAVRCLEYKNGKLEAANSRSSGILFIPIIIEDINDIFACITRNFQYQDFRNPYDLQNQLIKIAYAIHTHLDENGSKKSKASGSYSNHYIKSFNEVPHELRSNDYRKMQFIAQVLETPMIRLLANSNRKLNDYFDYGDTSNILLAPHTIPYIEKTPREEIWVISENLNNDLHNEAIIDSVQSNMRDKGVLYRYFVRHSKGARLRSQLEGGGLSQTEGKYQVIDLPSNTFLPFEELVIYDPKNEELRAGYIQMTYDDSEENKPVFIRCPSQLIDESIEFLNSCYLPTSEVDNKVDSSANNKVDSVNFSTANNETNTHDLDELTNFLKDHFRSYYENNVGKINGNSIINYFARQKNNDESRVEDIGPFSEKHIVKELISKETIKMRANYDLDLEKQILNHALQLTWRVPSSHTDHKPNHVTGAEEDFLSSFIGKIDDINSMRRTQDSLVTLETIARHERSAKEEIIIISPLLHNDLFEAEIEETISTNIRAVIEGNKNIHYHYFYFYTKDGECGHKHLKGRDGDLYSARRWDHERKYTKHIEEILKNDVITKSQLTLGMTTKQLYNFVFRFYRIPHTQVIFPFNEIVIFDPNDNQCNLGYMLLNYGDLRTRKVAIKLAQRMLAKLCNILLSYKKKYVTH